MGKGWVPGQEAVVQQREDRRHRTRLLGVTFPVGRIFHGLILRSLYREADAAGYEVVLSGVTPERSDADAVGTLVAERCEALLLVASELTPDSMARLADSVPVVSVLRAVPEAGVSVVRTDDEEGVLLAVAHLRRLGHRDIAVLDGGREPEAPERRRGYRHAMLDSPEMRETVLPGGKTERDGALAAEAYLALGDPVDRPTAVTAFNDRCAIGFVDVVRRAGVRVPEDVSVVGFDDIEQAGYPHVALTTVHQDAARLGSAAVRAATTRLDDASRTHPAETAGAVITPELVVRSSTAPPRDRTPVAG